MLHNSVGLLVGSGPISCVGISETRISCYNFDVGSGPLAGLDVMRCRDFGCNRRNGCRIGHLSQFCDGCLSFGGALGRLLVTWSSCCRLRKRASALTARLTNRISDGFWIATKLAEPRRMKPMNEREAASSFQPTFAAGDAKHSS